jgi:hypothetical protein
MKSLILFETPALSPEVITHDLLVDVATVVSMQPTLEDPIISPTIYEVPSTGTAVIVEVEVRTRIPVRPEGGVVYVVVA